MPGVSAEDETLGFTYVRRRAEVVANGSGYASYGETRVVMLDGERIERKRVLTHREYGILSSQADPSRHIVRTLRTCFNLGTLSLFIERFQAPCPQYCLMYVQAGPGARKDERFEFPAFIQELVQKEVTGESAYASRTISTRDR